jgi:hypothetical protein
MLVIDNTFSLKSDCLDDHEVKIVERALLLLLQTAQQKSNELHSALSAYNEDKLFAKIHSDYSKEYDKILGVMSKLEKVTGINIRGI